MYDEAAPPVVSRSPRSNVSGSFCSVLFCLFSFLHPSIHPVRAVHSSALVSNSISFPRSGFFFVCVSLTVVVVVIVVAVINIINVINIYFILFFPDDCDRNKR